MELKYLLLAIIILPIVLVYLFVKIQGNDNVVLLKEKKSKLYCQHLDDKTAVFYFTLPYINIGKQESVILDAFARTLLPREQFDLARVSTFLECAEKRRDDNYLEAFVLKLNAPADFIISMHFDALADNKMQDIIDKMVDVTIDVYTNTVGREDVKITKTSINILLEEFAQAAKEVEK